MEEPDKLISSTSEVFSDDKVPSVIYLWRLGLETLVLLFEIYRPRTKWFTGKMFVFFTFVNVFCYWLAISTAFPFLLFSSKASEYFWLQIPVALLGSSFDTSSFFITIWIAKNALRTPNTLRFALHLSLDLLIALLATMWVVLVFVVSGWFLSYVLGNPEQFSERSFAYQGRLLEALLHPFNNMRNIYFGFIMGFSAGLPSFVHLFLFVYAFWRARVRTNRPLLKVCEIDIDEVHTEMSAACEDPTKM